MDIVKNLMIFIGTITTCFMLSAVFVQSMIFIASKIDDFKRRKDMIEKGTIFFLDGERVIVKKDIYLRFNTKKYTECHCDNYKLLLKGIQCGTAKVHKSYAKLEFEKELLKEFKEFPEQMKHLLEYQNNN